MKEWRESEKASKEPTLGLSMEDNDSTKKNKKFKSKNENLEYETMEEGSPLDSA